MKGVNQFTAQIADLRDGIFQILEAGVKHEFID